MEACYAFTVVPGGDSGGYGSAAGGAAETADEIVRAEKNGQFLSRYYPEGAFKRGEQGKVTFQLTIEPDGSIGECDVTESSGFKALDNETCDIMVRFARTKPMRNEDGRAIRAKAPGYIVWKLPKGATAVASIGTAEGTMPKPDKLTCKREPRTGSLVAKTKQCLTKKEWIRQEQFWREKVTDDLMRAHCDDRSCGPGGT